MECPQQCSQQCPCLQLVALEKRMEKWIDSELNAWDKIRSTDLEALRVARNELGEWKALHNNLDTKYASMKAHEYLVEQVRNLELKESRLSGMASKTEVLISWGLAAAALLISAWQHR